MHVNTLKMLSRKEIQRLAQVSGHCVASLLRSPLTRLSARGYQGKPKDRRDHRAVGPEVS
jgi:hypothetical protein